MHSLHQAILEALEPRTYLTTLYWNGGSSGTWDRSTANWNTAADGSGSQVAYSGGSNLVFNSTATVTISSSDWPPMIGSTITVSAGTVTFASDGGGGDIEEAYLNWTGGNIVLQTNLDDVSLDLDGGSGTFTFDGASGGSIENGDITWNSGNFVATGGGYIFNGSALILDGGSNTFTLDGSSLEHDYEFGAYSVEWDSGTIALADGANFNLDDESGGPSSNTFAIAADDTVTLDMSTGSSITHDDNVSIINYGTINWTGSDTDQLDHITNDGVIIFNTGSNPDLISLSGSSTATEGETYTLTLGSVSGDITDSVDAFAVDWGDGMGFDSFTSAGAVTHTYEGSSDSSTSYTIDVHLITDEGVFVDAAIKAVTVSDTAPVITLDDNTDDGTSSTTPTFSGTAGIAPGDASTVTLNIYSGSDTSGTLAYTTTADVDPDSGIFSIDVPDASALSPGTYTWQAVQTEDAGNTGTSSSQTFTAALQAPNPVANLDASAASATEIDLSWDAPPAADFVTGYSISVSTDYGETFSSFATASAGATSFAATGLNPLSPYLFEIFANNDAGSSSAEVTPLTWTQDGIAAPTGLTATLDGSSVDLTWENNSASGVSYEIEGMSADGNFVKIADATELTSWTGAAPASSAYYRVRAVSAGESAYSNVATFDPNPATPLPDVGDNVRDLSYEVVDGHYRLTWTEDPGEGFGVAYRVLGNAYNPPGGWVNVAVGFVLSGGAPSETSAMTYDLPSTLTAWPGGVEISIVGADSDGNLSCTNSITLYPPQTISAPTDLTAEITTDPTYGYGIQFNWTPSSDSNVGYALIDIDTGIDDSNPLDEVGILHNLEVWFYAGTSSGFLPLNSETDIQLNDISHFAILAESTPSSDTLGSALSDVVTVAFPDFEAPAAPGNLTAAPTPDGISLEWDNNSNNEENFVLQSSTDDSTWTTVDTADPDVASYLDASVAPETTEYYRVKATNSYGDSEWTYCSAVTAATPTIRITMDGVDHGSNMSTGGFVILNADDNNGSAITNGVPAVRDYDATNLSVNDPDLKKVTIDTTGTQVGDKVEIEVDATDPFVATGDIALWQDQKKVTAQSPTVILSQANQQIVFYVEGTDLSSYVEDIIVTATIEKADGTAYQAGGKNIQDQLALTVGPILTDLSVTANNDPRQSPVSNSEIRTGSPGFLTAGANVGAVMHASAVGVGSFAGLNLIQNIHLENTLNFDDTILGAVTTGGGEAPSEFLYQFNGAYNGQTLLDAPGADSPFLPLKAGPADENTSGNVSVKSNDSPLIYITSLLSLDQSVVFSVAKVFDLYAVWKYPDGSIITLGKTSWQVNYSGRVVGGKFIPNGSDVTTGSSGFQLTDAVPVLSNPVSNSVARDFYPI